MKKIISFTIIFSLLILYFSSSKINLINTLNVCNYGVDYKWSNMGNEVILYGHVDCKKIINDLKMEVYSEEVISDRIIVEGYSSLISDYVIINNRKVNVQLSINEYDVIIGSPLIKNSF